MVEANASIVVNVTWNRTSGNGYSMQDVLESGIPSLFRSLREAVGVWFNASKTLSCFGPKTWEEAPARSVSPIFPNPQANNTCIVQMKGSGAACWDPINCNSELNLINTNVQVPTSKPEKQNQYFFLIYVHWYP